jgi:DNA/RNA endonuclease G (NUC1)
MTLLVSSKSATTKLLIKQSRHYLHQCLAQSSIGKSSSTAAATSAAATAAKVNGISAFTKRFFATQKLTETERETSLYKLCNDNSTNNPLFASWEVTKDEDKDAIKRTFEFTDFNQAWGFMSKVALVAEKVSYLTMPVVSV